LEGVLNIAAGRWLPEMVGLSEECSAATVTYLKERKQLEGDRRIQGAAAPRRQLYIDIEITRARY